VIPEPTLKKLRAIQVELYELSDHARILFFNLKEEAETFRRTLEEAQGLDVLPKLVKSKSGVDEKDLA